MSQHLLLLDATALAYRALNSGPELVRPSDGAPIGGVLSFLKIMWRLLGATRSDQPTHGIACFDTPAETFRHRMYPAYKANRGVRGSGVGHVSGQFLLMREACVALGISTWEKDGYEADDGIATYARSASTFGIRVTIVSIDKDMMQLVGGGVSIVDPTRDKRIGVIEVMEKFFVPPHQVCDVQALAGDAVDNVPGVPGLSVEGAAKLVRTVGNVSAILAACERRSADIGIKTRHRINDMAMQIRLNRRLVELSTVAPIDVHWRDSCLVKPIKVDDIRRMLEKLGAADKLEGMFGINVQMQRATVSDGDPLEWWTEELIARGQRIPLNPQAGFYERRLHRNGAWIPARIWCEPVADAIQASLGHSVMRCEVGGKAYDPAAQWDALCQHPIAKEKYQAMMDKLAPGLKDRPRQTQADLRKPIDLLSVPVPHNPRPVEKPKRKTR